MNSLKTLRKSKYPKAADFLPVLLNHGVKYSLPEYSLFESGRAIPNKNNAITICKCLGCSLTDVEEFIAFSASDATQAKPAASPRMIPGRDISFQDLPAGNPKRSAGRWKDGDWETVIFALKRLGYNSLREYLTKELIKKQYKSSRVIPCWQTKTR